MVAILHNLTRMKIKEKIAIYNILLVLKQYELKVDIDFKISGFPLTLTLSSLKKEINLLSFGTIFIILSSVVLRQ